MAKLKIIRASAGSGKTYTLTSDILNLLLSHPGNDYYRRILAVTFTNKATAEMKERILKELHTLATGQPSNHLQVICKTSKLDEPAVRKKAGQILSSILHGYSWLRVETIDTFFQSVIRSFVRELNLSGYYNIELNQDKILNLAVEGLLDRLGNEPELLSWIIAYVEEKLEKDGSWDFTRELQQLGRSLFRENLQEKLPEIKQTIKNKATLELYANVLKEIKKAFENDTASIAQRVMENMTLQGLTIEDFFQTTKGPINVFRKVLNQNFDFEKNYVETILNNPDKWPSGKTKQPQEAIRFGTEIAAPALVNLKNLIAEKAENYSTSLIVLKNLAVLGLLTELQEEVELVRKERDAFLISDAAPFIQKLINHNNVPFIYEKAGNQFNHLLIDEFQDTSLMQWSNFRPLLENSLSVGHSCLVVGDVKQSIYRFRNSNWKILDSQVLNDLGPGNTTTVNLDTNWRSDANIVRFNNHFFRLAAELLDIKNQDLTENSIQKSKLYADVAQKSPAGKDQQRGFVSFQIISGNAELQQNNGDETEEDSIDFPAIRGHLIGSINELLESGFEPSDIAILVRHKKNGKQIAEIIVEANQKQLFAKPVGVISNESLFLHSSPAVLAVVNALAYAHNSSNLLAAANMLANFLYLKSDSNVDKIPFPGGPFDSYVFDSIFNTNYAAFCSEIRQDSLYLASEKICNLFGFFELESELVYIHSFLDVVFEFANKQHSEIGSFLKFWDEEGENTTISASESEGAVRILTIHKAKGLEFPVVIIPDMLSSFKPNHNDLLWVEPKWEPYSQLPLLPIKPTNLVQNSFFKGDFFLEKDLNIIDNLNLLYVAYTRAVNALYVFIKEPKKVKEKKETEASECGIQAIEDINSLIHLTLDKLKLNSDKEFELNYDLQAGRISYGKLAKQNLQVKPNKGIAMTAIQQTLVMPGIRSKQLSEQLLTFSAEGRFHQLVQGRIIHAVMEKVQTTNDLEKAVKEKVQSGILSETEGRQLHQLLSDAIRETEKHEWFSGKYKILTEADIVVPNGSLKRPDRIILKDNETLVVDYKTGTEADRQSHQKQVKEYMQLLTAAGKPGVKGYIWYLTQHEIIEVSNSN